MAALPIQLHVHTTLKNVNWLGMRLTIDGRSLQKHRPQETQITKAKKFVKYKRKIK